MLIRTHNKNDDSTVEFLFINKPQTLQGHHPDGSHAKFTNYSFDKNEFIRLVNVAADNVRNHADYRKFMDNNDRTHDEL